MLDLTILIPCLETQRVVERSIQENEKLLSSYPIIVINKYGGDFFKRFNPILFNQNTSWWFARRFGLEFVKTKYVLNLDVDTVLPERYVEQAIAILETRQEVGVVALNYAPPHQQDHLAFGTSIWRTEQFKELYDWRLTAGQWDNKCECKYMWGKLAKKGMRVETLPMEAKHLKGPTHQKLYISERPHTNGEC
jgi:glycosyltransferase involved in cell wall biosynthesis